MGYYDPYEEPDPDEWLAQSEDERIAAVTEYHRSRGIEVPNLPLHAGVHAAVETQVAQGDPPETIEALDRLVAEGLDRHDAVHAVGYVLAQHMFRTARGTRTGNTDAAYVAALTHLTARKWKKV